MRQAIHLVFLTLFFVVTFCGCGRIEKNNIDSMNRDELMKSCIKQKADNQEKADLCNAIAYKLSKYRHSEAIKYANTALEISTNLQYPEGIADANCILGLVSIHSGELDKGKTFFDTAKDVSEKCNYEIGLAAAKRGLGVYYQTKGQYDKAMNQFLESKELCEKRSNKRTLANCYHGMGVLYFYDKKTYDSAIDCFEKSLTLREQIGDKDEISFSYYSMGEAYQTMGDIESAQEYFEKAGALCQKIGNKYIEANVYQGKGDLKLKQPKPDYHAALQWYNNSRLLFDAIGEPFQIAEINRSIGICIKEMKTPSILFPIPQISKHPEVQSVIQAFEIQKKAVEISQKIGLPQTTKRIAAEIVDLYEKSKLQWNSNDYYMYKQSRDNAMAFLEENTMFGIARFYEIERAKEKAESIVTVLIYAGIPLLIFSLLIFNLYKKEQNARKSLGQKTEEIERNNKLISLQQKELKVSHRNLERLNDIGKAIIASLNADKIVKRVYKYVNKIMDAKAFAIGIYNRDDNTLEFFATESGTVFKPFSLPLSDENRLAVHCFNNQQEIIIGDFKKEYNKYIHFIQPAIMGKEYNSMIHLPLVINTEYKKKIGVITVQSYRDYAYSANDIRMLKNIATYAAIALDKATVVEEIKKKNEQIKNQAIELNQALVKERELSDLKDDFVYTLSHQYKTPLTGIKSHSQNLKSYLPKMNDSEIEELLDDILANVDKMRRLVDKLLHYGRKFNPNNDDLIMICQKVAEDMREAGNGEKNPITFYNKTGADQLLGFVDKSLVEILLENLLSNSINYSEKNSEIIVLLACDFHHAIIKVVDKGRGIPPEYLNLRDKRFHRGHNVKDTEGNGLGLSIVERYAQLHRGKVKYESKLNEGTTVTVILPLSETTEKTRKTHNWKRRKK